MRRGGLFARAARARVLDSAPVSPVPHDGQPRAVIVPTWRGCAPLADLGVAALRALWPRHPAIWVLTDAGELAHPNVVRTCDAASVELRRTDWVGVTRHGLTTLLTAGELSPADWVLLVIDDHAPARPVPGPLIAAAIEAAAARGAPYVRFHGREASVGEPIGAVMGRPLVTVDAAWPFYHSLHPAAWRVDYLLRVLDAAETSGVRDPWSFERLRVRDREHLALHGAWPSPFGGYLRRGRVDLGAALALRHRAVGALRRALLRRWAAEALSRALRGATRRLRALGRR